MVKQIRASLYAIEVPLPNSPLKTLNAYVVKDDNRNLIIDTGFNRTVCYDAMRQGLAELDVDLNKTDFMLTHMHADHTGLVARLATESSKVFFSRIDARVYDEDYSPRPVIDFAERNGFPAEALQKAMDSHPGFKYSPEKIPGLTLIEEGALLEYGGYRLQCIATPGHTQGHICLYAAEQKIFFSGDHVLYDITPHIESWSYAVNSLEDYLTSLDKVYDLPVELVLPGHRNFFTDLKARIDELKAHHHERTDEVMDVLGDRSMNAYEIAAGMTWDIECESWEAFPIVQKWFAVGEAIAHLRFLESRGRLIRNAEEKIITFQARS